MSSDNIKDSGRAKGDAKGEGEANGTFVLDLSPWRSSFVPAKTPRQPPSATGVPPTDTHSLLPEDHPQNFQKNPETEIPQAIDPTNQLPNSLQGTIPSTDPSTPTSDLKVTLTTAEALSVTPKPTHEPEIIGSATHDPQVITDNRARVKAEQQATRTLISNKAKRLAKEAVKIAERAARAAEAEATRIREREAIRVAKETAKRDVLAEVAADREAGARRFQEALRLKNEAEEQRHQEARAKKSTRDQAQRVQDLIALAGGPHRLLAQIRRSKAELSLYEFVKQAWQYVEGVPFIDTWHIKTICEHLELVTRGKIQRLIINIPPRCSKSLLVSVMWPAWIWAQAKQDHGPLSGPHVQMLFASYAQTLSERDAVKCRRLIESKWYQDNWGDAFSLLGDQNTKRKYETSAKGYRLATSVGGTLTGEGANIIVVDDPLNASDALSEVVLNGTNTWWDEAMSTRLNSPKTGAYVIIMQRLHQDDTTGHILAKDKEGRWVHLMLPMRFDSNRHCHTYVSGVEFFRDPRTEDGELLCPERFPPQAVALLEQDLGPFAFAGQMQQIPKPRGGGIIQSEWWQLWPPAEEEDLWTVEGRTIYPDFDFIFASLDCAATEKEENDYTACTVWGTFTDKRGQPKIMLISAWRGHYAIHDLVSRVMRTAKRRNLECDAVLIENKSNGHALSQELKRLMRPGDFALHMYDPKRDGGGDKVARMYAAQPTFAAKLVYAPKTSWADMVIDEVENFPKAKNDDLSDTVSQAVNWLRKRGLARMPFEHEEDGRPRLWQSGAHSVSNDYGV